MNLLQHQNMSKRISYLFMDVDGTLTDGKIYVSPSGELMKAFNIKDGYAIKDILPRKEIEPIIITGRQSSILEYRARELNIKHIYQGVNDKKSFFISFINNMDINISQVSYIGDDLNDLELMMYIKKNGGYIGCPRDAVKQIVEISDFISCRNGGDGAVREFIEYIN